MSGKEEFIEILSREDHSPQGADALLDYLENKSDFFTAPRLRPIPRGPMRGGAV